MFLFSFKSESGVHHITSHLHARARTSTSDFATRPPRLPPAVPARRIICGTPMVLKLVLDMVECRVMPDCICTSLFATSASSVCYGRGKKRMDFFQQAINI